MPHLLMRLSDDGDEYDFDEKVVILLFGRYYQWYGGVLSLRHVFRCGGDGGSQTFIRSLGRITAEVKVDCVPLEMRDSCRVARPATNA